MGVTSEIGFLDVPAFIIAIIYTIIPIIFFFQYSSKVIKPNRVSILGILFLYLNGLTYFTATIKNQKSNNREIKLRDFSNLSGAILGFGYCLYYIYIIYFKEQRNKFYIYLCLIIILLLSIILLGVTPIDTEILEYIGVPFNCLEYLPLGFNLPFLIRHKISDRYTLFSAIPGIINTIIWLIWAIKKIIDKDPKYHSLTANIIGFLLCLTQFIIYFIFKKEDNIKDALLDTETIDETEKKKKKKEKKSEFDEFI